MPPKATKQNALRYDVHPSVAMARNIITGMKQKTGRTLDEWVRFVVREGPPGAKARKDWLKVDHGLGTNYAGFIADYSSGESDNDFISDEGYLASASRFVDAMFDGPKADLRGLFEELVRLGRSLGGDVRVSPCRTIVPLFRNHVFAQIKPSTRTRLDLGLALKDMGTPERLIDTGGFAKKDRITRRIPISSGADIDDEVLRWMKVAYDLDA